MARWRLVDERVAPSARAAMWLIASLVEGDELDALDVAAGHTIDALRERFADVTAAYANGELILEGDPAVVALDVERVRLRTEAGAVWELDFELDAGEWTLA